MHLYKHFEDNGIILKNHHGGLKGRSTATARAVIENKKEDGYQNKKTGGGSEHRSICSIQHRKPQDSTEEIGILWSHWY